MKQPDEATFRALVSLGHYPPFVTVVDWLKDARDDQRARNDQLRGDDLTEGAVKAHQLTELLDLIAGAPASMTRIVSGRQSGTVGPS
jgi:hypothetical protein